MFPSMITPGGLAAGFAHLAELYAEQDRTDIPTVAVAERLHAYADSGARHIVPGLIGEGWRQRCDLLAEAVRLI
jgi:hypothetical protein